MTTLAPATTPPFGRDDGRRVRLVEVHDLSNDARAQRLANSPLRALSGTRESTLIAGLVITGTVPKRVSSARRPAGGRSAYPASSHVRNSRCLQWEPGWVPLQLRLEHLPTPRDRRRPARSGAFAFGATSLDAAPLINARRVYRPGQRLGGTTGIALLKSTRCRRPNFPDVRCPMTAPTTGTETCNNQPDLTTMLRVSADPCRGGHRRQHSSPAGVVRNGATRCYSTVAKPPLAAASIVLRPWCIVARDY